MLPSTNFKTDNTTIRGIVSIFFCLFAFSPFIEQEWSVTCKRWNVIYDIKKLFRRKQQNDWCHDLKRCVRYQELQKNTLFFQVYLGVRTCELFLCFAPFVFLGSTVFTSLFSLFFVTCEFNRFLHQCKVEPFFQKYNNIIRGHKQKKNGKEKIWIVFLYELLILNIW